jgi:predicted DNA-binding transcriptional regulator AlpA
MAKLTPREIETKYGISRVTVYKYMNSEETGKPRLSFETGDKGQRLVDEAEIDRVFGDLIKQRENLQQVNSITNNDANAKQTIELIEAKAKNEILQAKLDMSEKRTYELEDRLKKEETEKSSLLEIVKRLSLPYPETAIKQPIDTQKQQDNSPLTDKDTVKLTNKKRSLLSRLFGKKD